MKYKQSPEKVTNGSLVIVALGSVIGQPLDDKQWDQASLPVSMGGLGLRRAELHSLTS